MKKPRSLSREPDLKAINAENSRIGKELRRISKELKDAMWANDDERVKSLMLQNEKLGNEAWEVLKSLCRQ